jgi:DHA1 family bicyclomycin/chloramphenicol resistance-like MFS transporter
MLTQTGFYALGAAVTGRLLRRIEVMRLVPIGLMLIAVAAIGFGLGLRLLPLSLYTAMGPVVIWAFGSALVIPGATTAALAGFPKVAGAASALAGFLQIGVGLAGTAVAALLFSDPLAHVALPSKRESRLFAAPPEELETAVDPVGAIGAGGEEIERVVRKVSNE